MSIRALARHAQRLGKVFASPGTWFRYLHASGWILPRRRLHPEKPRTGVRACRPNEFWHMDMTVIRLLDGTKAFLHAVIDNYSRRILAWRLETALGASTSCAILAEAAECLDTDAPTVVTDSGCENVNTDVETQLELSRLQQVLARVEVSYSNSMIESWWRSLKHNWLYLHSLDSHSALRKLVAFYVEQHNTVMPHQAFNGHTPDEIYFGTREDLEQELLERRLQARLERVSRNRELTCENCAFQASPPSEVTQKAA